MGIDNDYISNTFIDIKLIYNAISHYKNIGFKMISVPSCVDLESTLHSIPLEKREYIKPIARNKLCGSYYVGSAEQSFIYLYSKNLIDEGYYMAITPCVRDEIEDELHLGLFLKIELILIGEENIDKMLNFSYSFFKKLSDNLKIVDSGNKLFEKDIMINDIEVGSYGIGQMLDGKVYTYGTGIAEPRLSLALSRK